MSDDWQVVEDALTRLAPPTPESRRAFMALARLREREAQLKQQRDSWIEVARKGGEHGSEQIARAEAAEARVAELEQDVAEATALVMSHEGHISRLKGMMERSDIDHEAAEARVAELERVREAAYNFDARFEERFIHGQAKPLNDALAALAHKEETP